MSKNPSWMTVEDLLCNREKYIIPIYQRNYDWNIEIEQLIDDLIDAQARNPYRSYHLGSLVVDRSDAGFELIDGQQRLTTLHILAAALGIKHVQDNLSFRHRQESSISLQNIRQNRLGNDAISQGFTIAQDAIAQKVKDKAQFANHLLRKTQLLRIEVPKGTDLNRYFEVMNSRGEQLKKHEILKARLMARLPMDEQATFATIWDACSDMGSSVHSATHRFTPEVRHILFESDGKGLPHGFEQLQQALQAQASEVAPATSMIELIEDTSHKQETIPKEEQPIKSKASKRSIIDFSNLLMHVLRIHKNDINIALNDSLLLDDFDQHILANNSADDIRMFLMHLLKCRILLDTFIIHRNEEEGSQWQLENAQGADAARLRMLQTMLHFSFMRNCGKEWLFTALKYTSDRVKKSIDDVQPRDLLDCLESWCDAHFQKPPPDAMDVYDFQKHPSHFVFNRLDYLIWLKAQSENWQALGMDGRHDTRRLKHWVDTFAFSYRESVEHYAPQNPKLGKPLEEVHRFGNLCLIDKSQNSSLSNQTPQEKKDFYLRGTQTIKSLKQALMLSYPEWSNETIIEHHHAMLALLRKGAK